MPQVWTPPSQHEQALSSLEGGLPGEGVGHLEQAYRGCAWPSPTVKICSRLGDACQAVHGLLRYRVLCR